MLEASHLVGPVRESSNLLSERLDYPPALDEAYPAFKMCAHKKSGQGSVDPPSSIIRACMRACMRSVDCRYLLCDEDAPFKARAQHRQA